MPTGESVLPTTLVYLLAALLVAFLAALWLSLILWTARDVRSRSDERLAQILAIVLVAILNLPGLVLYLLLRPAQTLEGAYQASLEEEALLAGLASRATCPGCGRVVEPDWRICPTCSTRLRKPCSGCQRPLELSWSVCPWCGTAAASKEAPEPSAAG